jgi:hypothetical protein
MVVAPTAHITTLKGNARTKQVKILILISLPRTLVNLREKKMDQFKNKNFKT